MSATKTETIKSENPASDVTAPAPVKAPSIDEVAKSVRSDAVKRPKQYLDEVQVPHGGE